MRAAGRTGAGVSRESSIARPLERPVGESTSPGGPLPDTFLGKGYVVYEPVDPFSPWSIRVVHYQNEACGFFRHPVPLQFRRDVFSLAGILGWNGFPLPECATFQLQLLGRFPFKPSSSKPLPPPPAHDTKATAKTTSKARKISFLNMPESYPTWVKVKFQTATRQPHMYPALRFPLKCWIVCREIQKRRD